MLEKILEEIQKNDDNKDHEKVRCYRISSKPSNDATLRVVLVIHDSSLVSACCHKVGSGLNYLHGHPVLRVLWKAHYNLIRVKVSLN